MDGTEASRRAEPGPLVAAARILAGAGRAPSAAVLLDRALAAPGGQEALRAALGPALDSQDRRMLDFAGHCIAALARLVPAPGDLALLEEHLSDRRPIDAARFRARLEETPRAPAPGWTGPVAYVLNTALPRDGSGYSTRSHGLARALLALGEGLHCVTRAGSPAAPATDPAAPPEIHDGVTYHHLPGGDWCGRWDYGYFRRAEAACLAHFRALRPRAVMAASNHVTAIPACLAARRLGLPFVYDVRGFWELSLAAVEPGYDGSPAHQAAEALERALAAEADLVFTLNGAMRDELVRRGVAPGRIALLPNAVDPLRFRPRPRDRALAARLGIAAGTPVIGYVGSFNSYEGLDDLARACAVLHGRGRDFRLVLVGEEPAHLRGSVLPGLQAIAAAAGMAHKVHLPGRVPAEEAGAWYSLVDIAPIPRRSTAVTRLVPPLKPFEAMAMEKAVVLTDLPPLAEILRQGETGLLVPAGDPDALAGALDRLVLDGDLRRRLGRAARREVERTRDWAGVARLCRDGLAAIGDAARR